MQKWSLSPLAARTLNDIICVCCLSKKQTHRFKGGQPLAEALAAYLANPDAYSLEYELRIAWLRWRDWLHRQWFSPGLWRLAYRLALPVIALVGIGLVVNTSPVPNQLLSIPSLPEYENYARLSDQYRVTWADTSDVSTQLIAVQRKSLDESHQKLKKYRPGSVEHGYIVVGKAFQAEGERDMDKALELLDTFSFDLTPSRNLRFLACAARGTALLHGHNPDFPAAQICFRNARQLWPDHPRIWQIDLGDATCALFLGKWSDARDGFRLAIDGYEHSVKRGAQPKADFVDAGMRSSLIQCYLAIGGAKDLNAAYDQCCNGIFKVAAVNGFQSKLTHGAILQEKCVWGWLWGSSIQPDGKRFWTRQKRNSRTELRKYPEQQDQFFKGLDEVKQELTKLPR